MMPWFLRDSERLLLERAGIEELSRSAGWLVGTEWHLDGELCLDAIIRAHGHDYEVRVSFPSLYPDAPAIVRPRKMQNRISSHQYGGADGPLCLEWGPDNWRREITAVQMLQSAHRLFDTENPLGQNRPEVPVVAPSRHRLTVGQQTRGEWSRWYASPALGRFFATHPRNSVGGFKFSLRKTGENWTALVHEAMPLDGAIWKDEVPTNLPGAAPTELDVGVWFKTELEHRAIGEPSKLADLQALLGAQGGAKLLAADGTSPVPGFQRAIAGVLIIDRDEEMHLFIVLSGDSAYRCFRVQSDTSPTDSRAPEAANLGGKTIGIVGLGSAGSKIAMSLARMGARKFYIADHDVLLPENLQRHALDWQGTVLHKVDAMAAAITQVAPSARVEVCRLHLTGQESNAAVGGALKRLEECDLLIDATASPRVFNLLAAVARTAGRPMIWLEVFAGGMGGLVARSRPGIDPCPQDMRNAYLQFCTENPLPNAQAAPGRYAAETADGEVLVASDADVAVIAHHAVRLVPDCFVPPVRSRFPYSMYLVGLAKGWVFEAPFATIPISMASYATTGWNSVKETGLGPENAEFLLGLIQNRDNAAPGTTGNNVSIC